MSIYPICDWCGFCEHCPGHIDCAHPCITCGEPVSFDQPGCMNPQCAAHLGNRE